MPYMLIAEPLKSFNLSRLQSTVDCSKNILKLAEAPRHRFPKVVPSLSIRMNTDTRSHPNADIQPHSKVDCPGVSRQIPASRRGPFEGLGTDAAQVTMAAGAVVKSFNVVEHV